MPTFRRRRHIAQLVVVLASSVIAVVGATESDEASDDDFRPSLVSRFHYGSAGARLKADAIKGIVTENRSERAGHSLVFDKAATSTTWVDEASGVESVSDLPIVGQRILQ